MNTNSIIRLYIEHMIKPLETIVKTPKLLTQYSLEEQQQLNQLLLYQYQELERIINIK